MSNDLMTLERNIPANLVAEGNVLGSLLIDPDAIGKVAGTLKPDHFYREGHGWIYAAMLALHERHQPIDYTLLMAELESQHQLEEIGGPAYLTELVSGTPTAMYVEHYSEIVVNAALLRRLISAAGKIAELAYAREQPTNEVIDQAERLIFDVGQQSLRREMIPLSSSLRMVVDRLDFLARNKDLLMGVPTGYTMLDQVLGGLQKSDLIIVAGRPGMGKSSWAMSVVLNAAKRFAARCAVFSLEMSHEQLTARLLSMETGIDNHRLRLADLQDEEWTLLLDKANALAGAKIYIDDTPAASVLDIRTKARRLYAEHGLDLIVIDYMQLMASSGGHFNENRQQEISQISRSLKALARELNVPIIALSQLSRAVEQRADKRPMLSDLRESGCLTGDSLVYLPDLGKYVPIQNLVGQTGFNVASLNPATWKLESVPVSNAFCTGTKNVFALRTQLGREIKATANHKFLTIEGWKRLDELKPGEQVALPRLLPDCQQADRSDAELAFLGLMIGDGCMLPTRSMNFVANTESMANYALSVGKTLFGDKIAPRITHDPKAKYQVMFYSATRLTHGKRNAAHVWAETVGLYGKRAHEKFVPPFVFAQSKEKIAVFLRHLWATDGAINLVAGKSPKPSVYYATNSEALAKDIQALLLRFEINARIGLIPMGDKGRTMYHVVIDGQIDILRFINEIGTVNDYRTKNIALIRDWYQGRVHNTNRDIIPAPIWKRYVKPAMVANGVTHRELHSRLNMAYAGMTLFKQNVSRERAERVAVASGSADLAALAHSDVYWDQVVSVTPAGQAEVYDLTVPAYANFVANNIVVHNSIEQDSDVVLFIYREDYYVADTDRQNIADIIIAKHRHGATGTVSLFFRKELTQFRDLEINRVDLEPVSY